jgi:WD40 repeat protein
MVAGSKRSAERVGKASHRHRSNGPALLSVFLTLAILSGCDDSARQNSKAGAGGGETERPFPRDPPTKHVTAAAFSPDNKLLLTGYLIEGPLGFGLDLNLLDLWDVQRGVRLSAPGEWKAEGKGYVGDVSFVPNSDFALSAGPSRGISIWDVHQHKLLGNLDEIAELGSYCVGTSPDGSLVFSVHSGPSGPCRLRVWDLNKRKLLRNVSVAGGRPKQLVISPDGGLAILGFLATRGDPRTVEIRRLSDGEVVRSFSRLDGWSSPATFSRDSKGILMVREREKALVLLDIASGKEVRRFDKSDVQEVSAVAFSADGHRLFAFAPSALLCWDTATGQRLLSQSTDSHLLSVFSPDGRLAFSAEGKDAPDWGGGINMTLRVWDSSTGKLLRTLREPPWRAKLRRR